MKRQCFFLLIVLGGAFFSFVYGQDTTSLSAFQQSSDSIVVGHLGPDKKYREDQFYVGFTFNLLANMPSGVRQSGFSGGIHAGFIRDIPLNEQRNIALGVGAGWSVNSYRLNLLASQTESGASIFQVLTPERYDYDLNRYMTYLVEVPIQFRWRTSTASRYKFWRIYAGLRLGYMYYFQSKFEQVGKQIVQTQIDELNRFRYGATFTFGYNTFNFTVYYSLNPFFDAQTLEGQPVGLSTFKVGLMFYIF